VHSLLLLSTRFQFRLGTYLQGLFSLDKESATYTNSIPTEAPAVIWGHHSLHSRDLSSTRRGQTSSCLTGRQGAPAGTSLSCKPAWESCLRMGFCFPMPTPACTRGSFWRMAWRCSSSGTQRPSKVRHPHIRNWLAETAQLSEVADGANSGSPFPLQSAECSARWEACCSLHCKSRFLLASRPSGVVRKLPFLAWAGPLHQAAAAMNVDVGYFSDPAELPGLAHFLGQPRARLHPYHPST